MPNRPIVHVPLGAPPGSAEAQLNIRPIEFWFDFASTYSYLSVMRIAALASKAHVPLVWRPFLLGPIFQKQGWHDSPFNLYPAKGRYMWRDLERRAAAQGLPLVPQKIFPKHSLLAARVGLIAAEEGWCPAFARGVFHRSFAEDEDIAQPDVLAPVIEALGHDPAAVLARAQSPENKDALRQQTERAEALGIFGAPSFVVGTELFWGDDRLEDALAWAHRRR